MTAKCEIVYDKEPETSEDDDAYLELVRQKFEDLDTAIRHVVDTGSGKFLSSQWGIANLDMTIRWGELQKLLYDEGFFLHGHEGYENKPVGVSFQLHGYNGSGWKSVWNKIKNIKEIKVRYD